VGVLVLEPVASEIRNVAAQKFAQIMQLDPTLHGYSTSRAGGCTGLAGLENCAFRSKLALSWGSLFWAILAEIQKRVFKSASSPLPLKQWLFAKTNRVSSVRRSTGQKSPSV